MNQVSPIHKKQKERLTFIDMARSIAILLMLEGHFTGATLSWDYRTYEYTAFKIWHLAHGLTSPLFFTVTGLIFVYLLIGKEELPLRENIRIKKGRKRIFQLLFWGYLIQLNLWSIGKSIYYGTDFHLEWLFAFHVLQSIAVGIALIIFVYLLYRWIKRGSLTFYYLIAGLILFGCYAIMKDYIQTDQRLIAEGVRDKAAYWPPNFPALIQNMFYGPYSDFSFVRMSGYTLFGGMIGSIIKNNEANVKKWWFGTLFIVIGLLISVSIRDVFVHLDTFTEWLGITSKGVYELNSTSISRFGQVVVLIGILIFIDKFFTIKQNLFLKIGQNTFPVYVVHVIILYGGIFGFGLKPMVFDRNLEPYTAIAISAAAIAFFMLMVKYIEPLEKVYNRVLYSLRLKKKD